MKPDKIKIEDLEVFANHGVFPEENILGQKFVVSAVMYTDTRRAGLTDELTASIHYGEASAFITEYLKSHTFKLLEKVAEGLAEEIGADGYSKDADRKSTRLNSSHKVQSRMPSSA